MKKFILGIDIGTSGVRAIVFDRKSNIIAKAYSELNQYFPKAGWIEQDAGEIYRVTREMVEKALQMSKIEPKDIVAIGIANQRETTIFWDKVTGKPVCPAIVWQDRRNVALGEQLKKQCGEAIEKRTGMLVIPNNAATKIQWLMQNNKEIEQGVESLSVLYGTVDSWIVWKLTGGEIHVTDHSNNSVTLLQNAETLKYDAEVLRKLKIPKEILPQLCCSSEIIGYTSKEEFFGERIPIAGIAGDQQAAAIGQGCFCQGMAKNTYGTGSFMVMNTGERYVPPTNGLFSPILYTTPERRNYSLEGMSEVSGALLQWLRDKMCIVNEIDEVEVLAKRARNNGEIYIVPAFVGLGVPYLDPYARGVIYGVDISTTKEELCRAAIESMAFQVRDVFEVMQNKADISLETLRVDGGGAKNDFLLQFQADILDIPIERPVITETTCLGAVYLAGLAVGYWESLEEIMGLWKRDNVFEPQMKKDERDELYGKWKKAVENSKGWLE